MKLQLQDISMSFSKKQILSHLSMDVKEEEFISILGPSGCGKKYDFKYTGRYSKCR